MQKFIISIVLFFFSVVLNATELRHADSYQDALVNGKNENKVVVLFAHHPQCPWCRKMKRETLSNTEVIQLLNEKFIFVTVDLSLDIETEDVPMEFLPEGTPVTYIIDPATEEKLYSLRGYKSPESFLKRLKRL